MNLILIGLALLVGFLLLVRWLVTTTPEKAYPVAIALALILVGLAVFMGFSGRLAGAIPFILGLFAIYDKVLKYRGKGPHAAKNKEGIAPGSTGKMTRDEAYEVLGLTPGANRTEIKVAYKNLMQKLHPDKEGNEYLAQKVNEARDTLLDKK